MKPLTVGLVDFGERLPLSLPTLAKTLNGLQTSYRFDDADVITADVLGAPDIESKWFEIPRLLPLLKNRCRTNNDFFVGVTNCRITHSKELQQFQDSDPEYFSRSDLDRFAIVSVHALVLRHTSPGTEMQQYAAFSIITELLNMTAKMNLNHDDNKHCAMYECGDRDELGHIIREGLLCPKCRSALKRANVSDDIITSAERVLKWSSRNSWRFTFSRTLEHPAIALLMGTSVGWFSCTFLPKQSYPIVAALTLLPILVMLFIMRRLKVKP